jgi:hypothetical protein
MSNSKLAVGKFTINVSPKRTLAEFRFPSADGGISRAAFTTGQIDFLIAQLANIRSTMIPEVPRQYPQASEKVHVLPGGDYYLGYDPMLDRCGLSFRSGGFGWLSFDLPEGTLEAFCGHIPKLQEVRAAARKSTKH